MRSCLVTPLELCIEVFSSSLSNQFRIVYSCLLALVIPRLSVYSVNTDKTVIDSLKFLGKLINFWYNKQKREVDKNGEIITNTFWSLYIFISFYNVLQSDY